MKHTTMKHPMIASLAVLVTSLTVQGVEPTTGSNTPSAVKTNPASQWRSQPPADCPFKPSASLTGFEFTGCHSDYRYGTYCLCPEGSTPHSAEKPLFPEPEKSQ